MGIKNCDIVAGDCVGGLVGSAYNCMITFCYATGSIDGNTALGGLVGELLSGGTITDCYSSVSISSNGQAGGLVGYCDNSTITSSYATGNLEGYQAVGGLVGQTQSNSIITSCYATGNILSLSGSNLSFGCFIGSRGSGSITSCYYNTQTTGQITGVGSGSSSGVTGVTTDELNELIANGTLPLFTPITPGGGGGTTPGGGGTQGTGNITLQVGIDSSENSRISFDTALSINLNVNVSTTTNARNVLDDIDAVLDTITAKQTEFGAVQNRLESVIDSLDVSIENTTSSLSTIKDADIAKVSSDFIRAQILQQASATLLATANQLPSVALGLL